MDQPCYDCVEQETILKKNHTLGISEASDLLSPGSIQVPTDWTDTGSRRIHLRIINAPRGVTPASPRKIPATYHIAADAQGRSDLEVYVIDTGFNIAQAVSGLCNMT